MGCAVSIGFYDGVHIGHQHLLRQLRAIAQSRGIKSVAVTFRQHPSKVFAPDKAPRCICPLTERIELLKQYVDDVIVLDFNSEMSKMTAREFVRDIIREQVGAELLLIGFNNRFGSDNISNFSYYDKICSELGVEAVMATRYEGTDVSSTLIRQQIINSDFMSAAALLGRPFVFSGSVEHGYHNGTKIGFPTANLSVDNAQLLPHNGVYACWAKTIDMPHPMAAMLNIGCRPTFKLTQFGTAIEVHIIDWENPRNLYGEIVEVEPVCLIRRETNFPTIKQLQAQLDEDKINVTKKLLKNE